MSDLATIVKNGWIDQLEKSRSWAEGALAQLSDEEFFHEPALGLNSCAIIANHLAGSMTSRFTDFLTTDGEKPWRHREREFDASGRTREEVMRRWAGAFDIVIGVIEGLSERDLCSSVTIRSEPHSVPQAIDRVLVHVAYHAGQILWAARMVKGEGFAWQTIAPERSEAYNAEMWERFGRRYDGPGQ